MAIIATHNISIEQFAVFSPHAKGGMPEKLLQGEGIAAAIQQVFPREGMTEKMY